MQKYSATVTDLHNVTGIVLDLDHFDINLIDLDCKDIAEEIMAMFCKRFGEGYKTEIYDQGQKKELGYKVVGPNGPVFEITRFDNIPPIYVRPSDEISNGAEWLLSRAIANCYGERFNQPVLT